jgi:CSLREA domain-containing protein
MTAQTDLTKLISRLILILAIALLCLGSLSKPSLASPTITTFTVDSTADYHVTTYDGNCKTNGVCTLREAIEESNHISSGSKVIGFDPSLYGQTIYLDNAYGALVVSGNHISVDGSGIGGEITIDAYYLSASNNLFEVRGDYNTLTYLKLHGWPDKLYPADAYGHGVRIYDTLDTGHANYNTLDHLVIYGFEHDGILISGDLWPGGHHNTVSYSLIGAQDMDSTYCGNRNGEEGIEITNRANNTTINNNTIVCNANSGIYLNSNTSWTCYDALIQSNTIGNNGDSAMGNGLAGIADTQSNRTTIDSNLISGNVREGIWMNGTYGATITANKIGVDKNGSLALPNGLSGIVLTGEAADIDIGSFNNASQRNIISGNGECGVDLIDGPYQNNITGNFIGLGGSDGMTIVPNNLAGICFFGVGSNSIGSYGSTVYQYISGNAREGIYAENATGVNIMPDTFIGVKGDGTTPAGNGREGVFLYTYSGTTNSTIEPAKVMYNGLAGIAVLGDTSTGNKIKPGIVAHNGGIAIDLGNDGFTPNYSKTPPGPNNWKHYPVFYSFSGSGFTGNTCVSCGVNIYKAIGNPTANQGGGTYLATVYGNAVTGNFDYTFPPGILAVTMQTWDTYSNDCSEMSPMVINPSSHKNFVPMVVR